MSAIEILKSVFGVSREDFIRVSSQHFEVNGLTKGAKPQNCLVLGQGHEPHSRGDRREHFLVDVEGATLFFRMCTASPGSGYDEYACGQIAVSDEQRDELRHYASGCMERMCHPEPRRHY